MILMQRTAQTAYINASTWKLHRTWLDVRQLFI